MIERFWEDFVEATGIDGVYTAWGFGDESNPDQVTELGRLVRDGPKRATTGLLAEYEDEGEELPSVGDLSVILDGAGSPLCVIRTNQVDVARFADVDEAFAWDEGEGDRSLTFWQEAHRRFFTGMGFDFDADSLVVLERFELLWAPQDITKGDRQ